MMHKYEKHGNLLGIPRAPVLRFNNIEEYNFERMKEQCVNRLPILTSKDVLRLRQPYNYLIQQLLTDGYGVVVEEILQLKQKEDEGLNFCKRNHHHQPSPSLTTQLKLLVHITDVLKYCYNTTMIQKQYMEAAKARFQLAEELIDTQDTLARHFLLTSLALTKLAHRDENCLEFQTKLHCFLGYIGRKNLEEHVEKAIQHLERARILSRNKSWWFHTSIIKVEVEKPISACGLRDDKETICCTGMSVYRVATLLYYDILMKMIKETSSLHLLVTKEDYDIVFHLSEEVLAMAREIRNPLVIASALTRYGIFLKKSGAFNEALEVFHRLSHESELNHDFESMAIAHGNIAHCLQERRHPLEALDWFYNQSKLGNEKNFPDLEAEGIERMGYILLQEGQSTEAEQCIYEAYEEFVAATSSTPKKTQRQSNFVDTSWAMAGVMSGMNVWGRFAGLCRHNDELAINSLLNWKDGRWLLNSAQIPNNNINRVEDYFDHLDDKKIPTQDNCDLDCLKKTYPKHFRTFQIMDPKNLFWDNPLLSGRCGEENFHDGDNSRHHHRQSFQNNDHQTNKRRWSFRNKRTTIKEKLVNSRSHQDIDEDHHTSLSFQLDGPSGSGGFSSSDGGRDVGSSNSRRQRHRRHHQVSIMSDATSGTPKMSAVSIPASSESMESIFYASDQWSQSTEDRRKRQLMAHTSNTNNTTLLTRNCTLSLHPTTSKYHEHVSTTMSQMEFQRKSVVYIQSQKNIINPDLVLRRDHPVDLQFESKTKSTNTTTVIPQKKRESTIRDQNMEPKISSSGGTTMTGTKDSSGMSKGSSGLTKGSSGLTTSSTTISIK